MKKALTWTAAIVDKISESETIQRAGKEPVEKKTITLVTEDGQKGFFEARKIILQKIERLGIQEGTKVNVGFVYVGTEKNGKVYNNLFINDIEYVQ